MSLQKPAHTNSYNAAFALDLNWIVTNVVRVLKTIWATITAESFSFRLNEDTVSIFDRIKSSDWQKIPSTSQRLVWFFRGWVTGKVCAMLLHPVLNYTRTEIPYHLRFGPLVSVINLIIWPNFNQNRLHFTRLQTVIATKTTFWPLYNFTGRTKLEIKTSYTRG